MENGSSEVSKAFRRAETSERRAVDGAHVTGCLGWGVGHSGYGGYLVAESVAEVVW